MRIAIPHWQGRVSPVFDVADNVLLVDLDQNIECGRRNVTVKDSTVLRRTRRIAGLGVDTLICGAISWPLELALFTAGIEVLAQTCGDVEQVIEAYRTGRLEHVTFRMPGCDKKPRRRHCRRRQTPANPGEGG